MLQGVDFVLPSISTTQNNTIMQNDNADNHDCAETRQGHGSVLLMIFSIISQDISLVNRHFTHILLLWAGKYTIHSEVQIRKRYCRMRRRDREVTDLGEICAILDACKTCHVAMQDDTEGYIVPLNYGYTIEKGVLTLYFHSAPEGRKIDIWRKRRDVCFAITREGALFPGSSPCAYGYAFSSVIGWGRVEFIEEVEEKCRALSVLFRHQTGRQVTFTKEQTKSLCIYKIICTKYTAKQRPVSGI